MTDTAASFLQTLDQQQLSGQEKIELCEKWLQENVNDPTAFLVQMVLEANIAMEKLAKDNEKLAKETEKLAKETEKLAQDKKRKALEALCNEYPILQNRTITTAHISPNHEYTKVVNESGGSDWAEDFRKVQEKSSLSDFWETPFSRNAVESLSKSCDAEIVAQNRVQLLLESVIEGLGLHQVIEVVPNRTLAGIECDLLLVLRANRLPFAPIEVKKPNYREVFLGKELNAAAAGQQKGGVAGQVYDECHAVKLFGHPHVFGMLTDWNHWRLSCTEKLIALNENDIKRLAQHCPNSGNDTELEKEKNASPPPRVTVRTGNSLPQKEGRTLYCSEIVPGLDCLDVSEKGCTIVSFVALFVLKAYDSISNFADQSLEIQTSQKRPCRILDTADEQTFAFGSVRIDCLWLQKFPSPSKRKVLYVLYPLGVGSSGDCCIAATKEDGKVCVVKFFVQPKLSPTEQAADVEMKNWNTVYKERSLPNCFTIEGINGPYLAMPYLKPIPTEKRIELLQNGKIKSSLQSFSSSGYIHEDIRWHHFGWWENELYLLDLGRISNCCDQSSIAQWIDQSLEHLKNRAGTEENLTPNFA